MATPIDLVVFKCRKICPTGNRWNASPKQKTISAPSQTVATARIAPKICRGQPQHMAHKVPNFIPIGSLSAELFPNSWMPFFWTIEYLQYSPVLRANNDFTPPPPLGIIPSEFRLDLWRQKTRVSWLSSYRTDGHTDRPEHDGCT